MEATMTEKEKQTTTSVLTAEELREHWQGHRKLTRKMIEVFPEDKMFNYSIGGMRPFSTLIMEMIDMAGPGMHGVVSGKWLKAEDLPHYDPTKVPKTKAELLELWDKNTVLIDELWPKISPKRFQETDMAFGQWEGKIYWFLFYFIDNEIHHRGQAYVYLRSLGIEPPAFWDRF